MEMNKVCVRRNCRIPLHYWLSSRRNNNKQQSILPALMFALKPVPFSIINPMVIQEFVDSMKSDEYYIMLLYYVSKGPFMAQ